MSRGRNRLDPVSARPSRLYVIFVLVMAGFLVIGSVALIAGTAFNNDDTDQLDASDAVRPGEEIARLQTAVAENPDDAESMAVLANILANSGQLADAITWYERATVLNPDDGDLRTSFGLALFQLGNDFDASVQLQRAHELLPDSATPPFYLGQINERGSNPDLEKAREWYETAVEIAPDSLVGQQAQDRLDALDSPDGTPTP